MVEIVDYRSPPAMEEIKKFYRNIVLKPHIRRIYGLDVDNPEHLMELKDIYRFIPYPVGEHVFRGTSKERFQSQIGCENYYVGFEEESGIPTSVDVMCAARWALDYVKEYKEPPLIMAVEMNDYRFDGYGSEPDDLEVTIREPVSVENITVLYDENVDLLDDVLLLYENRESLLDRYRGELEWAYY